MKKRYFFWLLPIIPFAIGWYYLLRMEGGWAGAAMIYILWIIAAVLAIVIGLGQYIYQHQQSPVDATVPAPRNQRSPLEVYIWITLGFIFVYFLREFLMSYSGIVFGSTGSTRYFFLEGVYSLILNLIGLKTFIIVYIISVLVVFRRSQQKKTERIA